MRIAFISHEYPPDTPHGGIATYVAQAARMMRRRGHSIEVFAASPYRSASIEHDGIVENWVQADNHDEFRSAVVPVFSDRHYTAPFDVIEGPEYFADADGISRQFPEIPLVLKVHTPSVMISMMNHATSLKRQTRLALWHKLFITPGPEKVLTRTLRLRMRNTEERSDPLVLLERQHALRASIVAPPCGDLCTFAQSYWEIPSARVRRAPHPYAPARSFLDIPVSSESKVVGFVGRLERRKGIEVLARAIPAIAKAHPQAVFRFVGAPLNHASGKPYDEWLRTLLPKYASRLEFYGKVPLERMHEVYAAIDVCVFPSLWENFPNVCLEAMAAGRAVVASMGGGMREMIVDRESGLLVPAGNAGSLARGVISLLKSPNDRQRFGMNARQRVLDAYNVDVIGAMMEAVYRDAIRLHQPAAPTGR